MESLDKLRAMLENDKGDVYACHPPKHAFSAGVSVEGYESIADDIEAELAERYIARPIDADGVPIHVGDVMEWPDRSTAEVVGIGDGTFFYVDGGEDAADWSCASDKRHHRKPTVEDILLDACKAYHSLMVESMSDVAHDMQAPSEIIAWYAAKLRLAGDGE